MSKRISIRQLRSAIAALPSDEPNDNPRVWYSTQKEHWLGWLSQYNGPGAYGRTGYASGRDARFAFNHIVNPEMLVWLIDAAGLPRDVVNAARRLSKEDRVLNQRSAAIRRLAPWEAVQDALWPKP